MKPISLASPLRLCPLKNPEKSISRSKATLDDNSFSTALRGHMIQLSLCSALHLEPFLPDDIIIQPYICYSIILEFQRDDDSSAESIKLILLDGNYTDFEYEKSNKLVMRSYFLIPSASVSEYNAVTIDDTASILLCDDYHGGHFLPHYSIANNEYTLKVPLQRHINCEIPVVDVFSLAYKKMIDFILDRITSAFMNPFINSSSNSSSFDGQALIVGRSGSGCTSVIVEVCRALHLPFIIITAGSVFAASFCGSSTAKTTSKHLYSFPAHSNNHQPAQYVYTAFMYAVAMAPCVLVFDDIHRLCSAKDEDSARILEVILCCLRTLHAIRGEKRVFVAFISTSEGAVPESLRNVLTETVVVPDSYPTLRERERLANILCDRMCAKEGTVFSPSLRADITAFATTLKQQAPLSLIHRLIRRIRDGPTCPTTAEIASSSSSSGIGAALPVPPPPPSAPPPPAMFADIAGMAVVKQTLVEAILWPRKYPDIFMRYGIRAAGSGLLLFGPPGTGKTLIPQVVARELNCSLLVMKLSEVVVGEVGGGEKKIAQLFAEARKAAPSIVFIDEFQALFMRGMSTMSAALAGCFDDVANWNSCMGSERLVTVIASTNEPWAIDSGFLRPGRLGTAILLGPLDAEGRRAFTVNQLRAQFMRVCKHTGKNKDDDDDNSDRLEDKLLAHVGLGCVVSDTEGFTGADMQRLITLANKTLLNKLEEEQEEDTIPDYSSFDQLLQLSVPCNEHFQVALTQVKPSVTAQEMEEYHNWQRTQRFNR